MSPIDLLLASFFCTPQRRISYRLTTEWNPNLLEPNRIIQNGVPAGTDATSRTVTEDVDFALDIEGADVEIRRLPSPDPKCISASEE